MRRRVILGILAGFSAVGAGCKSAPFAAWGMEMDRPYDGPIITADSGGRYHVIRVTLPGPGWLATLDYQDNSKPALKDAYVTVHEPEGGPTDSGPIVEQRLATKLSSVMPLRVAARVAPYGEDPPRQELPYIYVTMFGSRR